ncbi:MAG: heavy metal translocating P-type ATPase [Coriobacteriia bacterium]|nr:heavy metal translocating P-type ATPase [Coriobacteriia bacterium]
MKATINIPIGGMHCVNCAQRLEKALAAAPGVLQASVNFATEKALVVYDHDQITPTRLEQVIKGAGYSALNFDLADSTAAELEFQANEQKSLWRRLIIAAIAALPLLYLAMAPMISSAIPYPPFLEPMNAPLASALTQFVLCAVAIAAGYSFFTGGFKAVIQRSPNMDTLIALGSGTAFVYSTANTLLIGLGNHALVHELYFEAAAMIIALISLGKALEHLTKGKAGAALRSLMQLAPQTALVLRDGQEVEVPAAQVVPGDILAVKPGMRIPVDGQVLEGQSAVDESALTGESLAADKAPGDQVFAATLNTTGSLRFVAQEVGSQTVMARIIQTVEEAQGKKAPIARLADRVAGIFVPLVFSIALAAAILWYFLTAFGLFALPPDTGSLGFALRIFISVLVIACPCAMGLATPVAIMVGSGEGAHWGILYRSGAALEQAGRIDTVAFDKTGTLTEGSLRLTDVIPVAGFSRWGTNVPDVLASVSDNRALFALVGNDDAMKALVGADNNLLFSLAASVETHSEHPLAHAILAAAESRGTLTWPVTDFQAQPGSGVRAQVNGRDVLAGNRRLMQDSGVETDSLGSFADSLSKAGKTSVFLAVDGELAGILALSDTLKASSRSLMRWLAKNGLSTLLISGDNYHAASAAATKLGIAEVYSEVLPDEKAQVIAGLQAQGRHVAMVGDGINDAVALTQADTGVAIGNGTDIAIESADIVLMHDDLINVARAISLARATLRTIKQNLFWAFAFNTISIPIAAGLLYVFGGPLLNPMISAAAMSASSLIVMGNALRLRSQRRKLAAITTTGEPGLGPDIASSAAANVRPEKKASVTASAADQQTSQTTEGYTHG